MISSEESHLNFSIVDRPFDEVAPAVIGVARALWGQLSVHGNDLRRSREIMDDQAARLANMRLLFPQMGLSISGAPNGYTLVEDPTYVQITRWISKVLPVANLLGISSWTEGKVRVCQ